MLYEKIFYDNRAKAPGAGQVKLVLEWREEIYSVITEKQVSSQSGSVLGFTQ